MRLGVWVRGWECGYEAGSVGTRLGVWVRGWKCEYEAGSVGKPPHHWGFIRVQECGYMMGL